MGHDRVDAGRGRGAGVVKPTPSKGKRREPPRRTKNSTRIFYLALVVVAVAGIGALSWMTRRPAEHDARPVDSTLPKVQSNGYVMGSASAPVEIVEFGDFECPQCARFATLTEPDVRTRLVDKVSSASATSISPCRCTVTRGPRRVPPLVRTNRGNFGRCTTRYSKRRISGMARQRATL